MWRKLRNWFLAGIVVLLPLWLTLFLIYWSFTTLDDVVTSPLRQWTRVYIPGVGVLLLLIVTLLIGWLTTVLVGQKLLDWGDRVMLRLPVVRAIYSALKQITDAVIGQKERAFSRVVLLEYPRLDVFCLGFVSGELPDADLVRVWVPNGPNPSGGPVVMVPMSQLVYLPMTVEDGLKFIVSAGVLAPKETDASALAEAVAELRSRRAEPQVTGRCFP
jgi:uncharacterized membrane protein